MQIAPAINSAWEKTSRELSAIGNWVMEQKDLGYFVIPVGLLLGFAGIAVLGTKMDSDSIENSLNRALASGDEAFIDGGVKYAAQCTRPGEANAFEIGIDSKTGDKIIATVPSLDRPVRAAKCER